MDKKYFVLRLIPSRHDFVQTMTEEERLIMTNHVACRRKFMNRGKAIVFGPVTDPDGVYGPGVVSVDDEPEVKDFIDNDPAGKTNP